MRNIILAVCITLISGLASGEVVALLIVDSTTRVVVEVDPSTGAAVPVTSNTLAMAGYSSGVSYAISSSGKIYFAANAPGETTRTLYTIDMVTGAALSSVLITSTSPPLLGSAPGFLTEVSGDVVAILSETAVTKYLVKIDTLTGSVTPISGALSVGGFSSGVSAAVPGGDFFHFVATDGVTGERRIYSLNMKSGSLLYDPAPAIIGPAGYSSIPIFLEANDSGVLYTLLDSTTSDNKILVTLDPETGGTAAIGAGFPAGGFSSGVSAFDTVGGVIYFSANAPGETLRRLFSVDIKNGVLVANPVITSTDGYNTTPALLAVSQSSSGSPGRVPDGISYSGTLLHVNKNTSQPGDLDLSWGVSCLSGATDYSIHVGDLSSYYSHSEAVCTTAGVTSSTLTVPGSSQYFLVVPLSALEEGSYGVDSDFQERPLSAATCKPKQNLDPCP